jgi:hypothetical protein
MDLLAGRRRFSKLAQHEFEREKISKQFFAAYFFKDPQLGGRSWDPATGPDANTPERPPFSVTNS